MAYGDMESFPKNSLVHLRRCKRESQGLRLGSLEVRHEIEIQMPAIYWEQGRNVGEGREPSRDKPQPDPLGHGVQNCPHAEVAGGLAFCAPVSASSQEAGCDYLSSGVFWSAKGKPQRWGTAWSHEQPKSQLPHPLRLSGRHPKASITPVEAANEFSSSPAVPPAPFPLQKTWLNACLPWSHSLFCVGESSTPLHFLKCFIYTFVVALSS